MGTVSPEQVAARMRRACAILDRLGSTDHKIVARGLRYEVTQSWNAAVDWMASPIGADRPWEVTGSTFGYFAGRAWRRIEDSPEGAKRWEVAETAAC